LVQDEKFQHLEALHCIQTTLGLFRSFDGRHFEVMFRISSTRFRCIMEWCYSAIRLPDTIDAAGSKVVLSKPGSCSLKSLAWVGVHCFGDYFQMSPEQARKCCTMFDTTMKASTRRRVPSTSNCSRQQGRSPISIRPFTESLVCSDLDCLHTTWKNCPKAWRFFRWKEG
jgi:hypothetical protein